MPMRLLHLAATATLAMSVRAGAQLPRVSSGEGFDFSIRNIMRGPELYGRAPTNVRWLGRRDWELASYPVEDHAFVNPSSWTDEYQPIFELFQRTIGKQP